MTFEETKKHIEKEVSGICDNIADLYNELANDRSRRNGLRSWNGGLYGDYF